jgi:pimeloyl-ACP methyl ester carboxylesterase
MSVRNRDLRDGAIGRAGDDEPGAGATRWRRAGRWALRALGGLLALVVALAGTGAVYQALGSAADARAHPPPGRLVDVGGFRLHIDCVGERRPGTPTVVLEDGSAGVGSVDWRPVQALLAPATRVCAYDRAGLGWSDPGPEPRSAGQVAAELHALLRGAGEEGPYVLAGHSLGGYFNRAYAGAHPNEVVGMVLVDASHEDQWSDPATQAGMAGSRQLFAVCDRVLLPFGLWRLAGSTGLLPHPLLTALPPELRPVAAANFFRTPYCGASLAEITPGAIDAGTARIRSDRRPPGGMPLVVLSAGSGHEDEATHATWLALQRDLAGLSTNSRHEVLADAQHVSMLMTHAAPVAAAIRDVVEAAGSGRPVPR